jgi:hypothetical protein
MLDEVVLRRPEFVEGERITLGDGREWSFPRPMLREFRPSFSPDGGAKFGPTTFRTFGPGHLSRLDELFASDPGLGQIELVATMAAELLRRNYTLDDDQLGALLTYVQTEAGDLDEASQAMWQSLAGVVAGLSPKNDTSGG